MSHSDDVAYCGLYCKECVIKNDRISKLSGELLTVMKRQEFEKLAIGLPLVNEKVFGNLSETKSAISVLESMCDLDCEKNCKSNGGGALCEIRKCCRTLGLDGCWECDAFESCNTLATLVPVHEKANLKNIRLIREQGMATFLTGEKYW